MKVLRNVPATQDIVQQAPARQAGARTVTWLQRFFDT